jgi:FkbM family methyltransferase
MLTVLERGAAVLRRAGLGALVDRVGETVGGIAARRATTIDGVRLAGNHVGQLYYLRELAEGRDRFLVELLTRAAPPGGTAVDAGAHIGYLTVQLARAVGPQGRVFALEPEPAARRALARNLERNGVTAQVTVFPHALGAGPGRGVLHVGGGGETSSLAPLAGERATAEVEVVALDDVLPETQRVDVVKLDLEGAETDALRGMSRILARSPNAVLVVECNPGRLEAMGSSQEELLACLAALGLGVRLIDEDRRALVEQVAVTGEYANLICVHGQRTFEVLEEN